LWRIDGEVGTAGRDLGDVGGDARAEFVGVDGG